MEHFQNYTSKKNSQCMQLYFDVISSNTFISRSFHSSTCYVELSEVQTLTGNAACWSLSALIGIQILHISIFKTFARCWCRTSA